MRLAIALLCAVVVAVALAACGSDATTTGGGGPRVVATTTQLADIAREVAGGRAAVSGILRPNADPHDYEPRPSDARALADARLVLRSGGDVDGWLGDLIEAAGSGATTVTLSDHVAVHEGHEHGGHDHDEHDADPHWWQDPRNALTAVEVIRDALTDADPAGEAVYARAARAYAERIRALDAAIERCMRRIPAERRRLVTSHDSLGYFAERYGITVVGAVIPALSTAARASARETRELIRTIRREGVTTIFAESSVSARLEKAIADESGVRVGPALWADTLGPEGSTGATYLDALRFNAEAMAEGFSGGEAHCDLPQ